MIVSINQNVDNLSVADKYKALFARAYQALEKYDAENGTNYLKDEAKHDDGTFHSIDEYFAHLEYLFAIDKTFIMLPLDEAPFAINANTRTITNPKIVVMQNDQNSEIVIFTVDRYFDYKDLDTAFIYVQWTLPDGTEGASNIEMKDLSIPGKIRFGWPLDSEITSQKGTVKFSVRFWNVAKIKDENGVEKDTVVYSLNTLTSNLHISESLQPHLNEEYSVNSPVAEGFFKKAIINSQLHTENMAIPMNPRFDDPGLNLNAYESLYTTTSEDGETLETLTLMAQAVNSDTGELAYEWWYKPAKDDEDGQFFSHSWYPYNEMTDKDGVTIPGFSAYGGTVDHEHYVPVVLEDNDPLVAGENYYMLSGGKYVAYDGSLPRPQLYERFTTYTVPQNKVVDGVEIFVPVTGQYKVVATNSIKSSLEGSTSQNTSQPVSSRVCQLVSPNDIAFNKNGNLNDFEFFPVDAEGNPLSLDLSVSVANDDSIAAKRTFTWARRSSALNREEDEKLKDENGVLVDPDTVVTVDAANDGHKFNVTEPGWYQVTVNSTLNRETKTLTSTACKVTNAVVAPELKSSDETIAAEQILTMSYGPTAAALIASGKEDSGIPLYQGIVGDKFVLDVTHELNIPEGFDQELFSDGISYSWGYQAKEASFKFLNENDVGEGKLVAEGLGTPELKVNVLEDGVHYIYKCIITNSLNGQTASCDMSSALSFDVS